MARLARQLLGALLAAAGLAAGVLADGSATAAGSSCKALPDDADWPAESAWAALNSSVGGRLLPTVPVGSVCHQGGRFSERFRATACTTLRPLWNFSVSHYPYPGEVSFPFAQNQSCDPFNPTSKPCELGFYVSYSVNVTGAADVAAGIAFAKANNVRLVIKNTGHDYLGKSTGRGGLALWMHNLKTRELIPSYSSSYYSGPAIRLGAGVQGWEAYQFADGLGHRVVGGTCPTVGVVGGYTQGGGHSTLSSLHGLAADNVLEWEVVTAAGEHVVATPVNDYSDLYWAMSGGGGGTYAVALSMTVRAHPDGPIGGGYLSFNDSSVGHEAFWDAIGAFQSFVPTVAKDGVSVLYSMYNHSFSMFSLTAPDRTVGQVSAFMAPVLAELDRRAVPYTFKPRSWPTFLQYFGTDMGPLPYGPYSSGQVTGSRLIPRSILSDPVRNAAVTKALRATVFTDDFFVACQALDVSNVTKLQVASNSVLPAWRDAASHCILVGSWDYDRPFADMRAKEESLTHVISPALEAVTPGSGTYLNEANFQQIDFQKHFYGANYPKLRAIKKKYDPDDVFYAPTAVGSDEFVVDQNGRLCRATT